MARVDTLTDAELTEVMLTTGQRWDGVLDSAIFDDPPDRVGRFQTPAYADLEPMAGPLDPPPTTGFLGRIGGGLETNNRQAILNAARHRLLVPLGTQWYRPTVGSTVHLALGQVETPTQVADRCRRALLPDADWYTVETVEAFGGPPWRITVTLRGTAIMDFAPAQLEVTI